MWTQDEAIPVAPRGPKRKANRRDSDDSGDDYGDDVPQVVAQAGDGSGSSDDDDDEDEGGRRRRGGIPDYERRPRYFAVPKAESKERLMVKGRDGAMEQPREAPHVPTMTAQGRRAPQPREEDDAAASDVDGDKGSADEEDAEDAEPSDGEADETELAARGKKKPSKKEARKQQRKKKRAASKAADAPPEAPLTAEQRVEKLKMDIARLCEEITSLPEKNIGKVAELHELCSDKEPAIQLLAIVSGSCIVRECEALSADRSLARPHAQRRRCCATSCRATASARPRLRTSRKTRWGAGRSALLRASRAASPTLRRAPQLSKDVRELRRYEHAFLAAYHRLVGMLIDLTRSEVRSPAAKQVVLRRSLSLLPDCSLTRLCAPRAGHQAGQESRYCHPLPVPSARVGAPLQLPQRDCGGAGAGAEPARRGRAGERHTGHHWPLQGRCRRCVLRFVAGPCARPSEAACPGDAALEAVKQIGRIVKKKGASPGRERGSDASGIRAGDEIKPAFLDVLLHLQLSPDVLAAPEEKK